MVCGFSTKCLLSEFCLLSGDWGELAIFYFARTTLIKSYSILQNATVIAFIVSELLRENQKEGWGLNYPTTTTQSRVNVLVSGNFFKALTLTKSSLLSYKILKLWSPIFLIESLDISNCNTCTISCLFSS